MDVMDYEQQGFIKGATAKLNSTGYDVVLISNPKLDIDNRIKVWVAMGFDTHVRFLSEIDDIVIPNN